MVNLHTLPIADFIFYTHSIQNVDFITPCNFVIEVSIELCTIVSEIFKWANIRKLQDLEPLHKQCTA